LPLHTIPRPAKAVSGAINVTLNALGTVTPLSTATVRPQVGGMRVRLLHVLLVDFVELGEVAQVRQEDGDLNHTLPRSAGCFHLVDGVPGRLEVGAAAGHQDVVERLFQTCLAKLRVFLPPLIGEEPGDQGQEERRRDGAADRGMTLDPLTQSAERSHADFFRAMGRARLANFRVRRHRDLVPRPRTSASPSSRVAGHMATRK